MRRLTAYQIRSTMKLIVDPVMASWVWCGKRLE